MLNPFGRQAGKTCVGLGIPGVGGTRGGPGDFICRGLPCVNR
uniref:Uncharacterized protein n=1 Tax=uncultured Armatimonadetes bacterium TaxID=157466 RepID=A0A6J4JJF5_9BACT|nr:hypothetical protein AVDCRST_MAG63-3423 [uncultured Armatimonadetes bacterium]